MAIQRQAWVWKHAEIQGFRQFFTPFSVKMHVHVVLVLTRLTRRSSTFQIEVPLFLGLNEFATCLLESWESDVLFWKHEEFMWKTDFKIHPRSPKGLMTFGSQSGGPIPASSNPVYFLCELHSIFSSSGEMAFRNHMYSVPCYVLH
jgi:hypothetical protein